MFTIIYYKGGGEEFRTPKTPILLHHRSQCIPREEFIFYELLANFKIYHYYGRKNNNLYEYFKQQCKYTEMVIFIEYLYGYTNYCSIQPHKYVRSI